MRKARPGLQGSPQYQGAPLRIRTAFSWFGHDRGLLETNALEKVVELLSQQKSLCSWGRSSWGGMVHSSE